MKLLTTSWTGRSCETAPRQLQLVVEHIEQPGGTETEKVSLSLVKTALRTESSIHSDEKQAGRETVALSMSALCQDYGQHHNDSLSHTHTHTKHR